MISSIGYQQVRCKTALRSTVADGMAISHGVDHDTVSDTDMADIAASDGNCTRQFVPQWHRARATETTHGYIREVRTTNTTQVHFYKHVVVTHLGLADAVQANIIHTVHAHQWHFHKNPPESKLVK